MKSLICGLLCTLSSFAGAQTIDLPLTPTQIERAGIRFTTISAASATAGTARSAQVTTAPTGAWMITAPLAGVVTHVLVMEGEAVRAGQPLLTLRLPEAPSLASTYLQADSAARLAAAEQQRDRSLHDEGIIAERRWRAAEQHAQATASARDAARAHLTALGLDPQEARSGVVTLRAPAAAWVQQQTATMGQRVSEADPLLQLGDPKQLQLQLQLPLSEANHWQIGDRLIATEPALTARVQHIGWSSQPNSQSVTVRATLDPTAAPLRPGQWITVRPERRAPVNTSAVLVPSSAVIRHQDQTRVFIQLTTGLRAVPVRVLGTASGLTVVSGALQPRQRVAHQGLATLKSLLADAERAE